MNDRFIRTLLRAVAILIAVAAVVDPVVTSTRSAHPEIVVLSNIAAGSRADSALSQSVVRELASDFNVLQVPFAAAAATVLVGTGVLNAAFAEHTAAVGTPVFAIVRGDNSARATVASLHAPARVPLNNRVSVAADVQVANAKGKTLDAELTVDGAVVDKWSRALAGDSSPANIALSFVPTAIGTVHIRVVARIAGSDEMSAAERVIDVSEKKWSILFYDPRPSWMSTFVRRALERDTRFVVTSRTITSTNISTDAGKPPVSLNDAAIVNAFDAVIVGAPDALTDRDVSGLAQFMRRRGGGVALLFDEKKPGRYEAFTGTSPWQSATDAKGTVISGDHTDSVGMRATEWMWPASLPARAEVLAWNVHANNRDHALVWETSVGAGHLIVSTALDAWKFRDAARSGFDRFWQSTIGELAGESSAPVEVLVPSVPVNGLSDVQVTVISRRASFAPRETATGVQSWAIGSLQRGNASLAIRLWPTGAPGVFRGSFRAPDSAATYRVTGTADGDSASTSLVVQAQPSPLPSNVDADGLSVLTGATGGELLRSNEIDRLPAALHRAINASVRRVSWHPMRSFWWLVPFALLLSTEWWLRRRRGLA